MSATLGSFHSVALPIGRNTPRNLSWPVKDPYTTRTLMLDCTAFLNNCGLNITAVAVNIDASLTSIGYEWSAGQTAIALQVSGGNVNTMPVIEFIITLSNGDSEYVTVFLPIQALYPPLPTSTTALLDLVTWQGQPVTFARSPLTWTP